MTPEQRTRELKTEQDRKDLIRQCLRDYENRTQMIWDDMLDELDAIHGITEEEVDAAQ